MGAALRPPLLAVALDLCTTEAWNASVVTQASPPACKAENCIRILSLFGGHHLDAEPSRCLRTCLADSCHASPAGDARAQGRAERRGGGSAGGLPQSVPQIWSEALPGGPGLSHLACHALAQPCQKRDNQAGQYKCASVACSSALHACYPGCTPLHPGSLCFFAAAGVCKLVSVYSPGSSSQLCFVCLCPWNPTPDVCLCRSCQALPCPPPACSAALCADAPSEGQHCPTS